jgi:hypothetical protein
MNIPIYLIFAVFAAFVVLVMTFAFHQRFALFVLLFGVACAIWVVVLCLANNLFLDNIINLYIVIFLGAICLASGLAGVLLRLLLNWLRRRRSKASSESGNTPIGP